LKQAEPKPYVSGIILAGGQSSRLGQNKALIPVGGQPLVQRVVDRLSQVVRRIVRVTKSPSQFQFLDLQMVSDHYAGVGALAGLHAGLAAIDADYGLVVGCDMPFLNPALLHYMVSLAPDYDAVIPHVGAYYEPLHAIYSKRCIGPIEQRIQAGGRRLHRICEGMRVRYLTEAEIEEHDPARLAFFNVNSQQDLAQMYDLLAQVAPD
jgi:molybdopterin-guanine dinucleotide biosynthesis protein A